MKIRRRRPCPICAAHGRKLLFQQSFEQLPGIAFLDGYDVVVCDNCGLAFADGIPEQALFDAYYTELSKYEHAQGGGKESEFDEQRHRDVIRSFVDFVPSKESRILEIGCATGRLLAFLKDDGFASVQGLDPSPQCARLAWDFYKVPVFASTLFNLPSAPASYDFLILGGVLEHIEDIRKAVECLWNALAPGGRVFAEVPDASRLGGHPDAPYQEFSTEHINFFGPRSLTNLFETSGFTTIATGRAVRPLHEQTCPTAFGVYQKGDGVAAPVVRDEETEQGLRRYILDSESVDSRIRQTIRSGSRGRPILVWGTGTHTLRLLATGAFADVEIAGFVDSNPKYQGQQLHGAPVLSPADIPGRSEPVLISSRGFQNEIRDQIRYTLGLTNDLILLYEETAANQSPGVLGRQ